MSVHVPKIVRTWVYGLGHDLNVVSTSRPQKLYHTASVCGGTRQLHKSKFPSGDRHGARIGQTARSLPTPLGRQHHRPFVESVGYGGPTLASSLFGPTQRTGDQGSRPHPADGVGPLPAPQSRVWVEGQEWWTPPSVFV